jgi:hypothetical protein
MRSRTILAALLTAIAIPAMGDELPSFRIEAKDGALIPRELRVPSGRRIKIEIVNSGTEPIEFESLELRKEKVLAPGAASFIVIAPLRPGRYAFFDEFHQNTGQGVLIAE